MSTRLLTYRQAADLLACSPRTIARRVRSGLLTVVIDGGMRRIPERDLDRYVMARTLSPSRPGRHELATHGKGDLGGHPNRVRRLWEEMEGKDVAAWRSEARAPDGSCTVADV